MLILDTTMKNGTEISTMMIMAGVSILTMIITIKPKNGAQSTGRITSKITCFGVKRTIVSLRTTSAKIASSSIIGLVIPNVPCITRRKAEKVSENPRVRPKEKANPKLPFPKKKEKAKEKVKLEEKGRRKASIQAKVSALIGQTHIGILGLKRPTLAVMHRILLLAERTRRTSRCTILGLWLSKAQAFLSRP